MWRLQNITQIRRDWFARADDTVPMLFRINRFCRFCVLAFEDFVVLPSSFSSFRGHYLLLEGREVSVSVCIDEESGLQRFCLRLGIGHLAVRGETTVYGIDHC